MVASIKNKLEHLRQKLQAASKAKESKGKTESIWQAMKLKSRGMQAYRMAIWNSHLLFFVVVAQLIINVVLAIVVCAAYPLKQIEPMLIQAKGKDDVHVTITPVNPSIAGYAVLLESMVQKYVKQRESIDLVIDGTRWNEIKALSKPDVWKPFFETIVGSKEAYNKRLHDQVTREVLIRNVSRLDHDLFQVEWIATDKHLHEPLQTSVWVSILRFSTEPQKVQMEDRYANPLGFFVSAYSVSRKEDK